MNQAAQLNACICVMSLDAGIRALFIQCAKSIGSRHFLHMSVEYACAISVDDILILWQVPRVYLVGGPRGLQREKVNLRDTAPSTVVVLGLREARPAILVTLLLVRVLMGVGPRSFLRVLKTIRVCRLTLGGILWHYMRVAIMTCCCSEQRAACILRMEASWVTAVPSPRGGRRMVTLVI